MQRAFYHILNESVTLHINTLDWFVIIVKATPKLNANWFNPWIQRPFKYNIGYSLGPSNVHNTNHRYSINCVKAYS